MHHTDFPCPCGCGATYAAERLTATVAAPAEPFYTCRIEPIHNLRRFSCHVTIDGLERHIGDAPTYSDGAIQCLRYAADYYADTPEAAAQLVLCQRCHVAPASVTVEGLRLCEGCNAGAAQRLLDEIAYTGPRCMACDDRVERPGLCEACQEAGEEWPAPPTLASALIPVATLHAWSTTDLPRYRAALAALTPSQLEWQAAVSAAYATIVGPHITTEAMLAEFRQAAALHQSQAAANGSVCQVLFELSVTDPAALAAFLGAHTLYQRERLAWRYASFLRRECKIERTPQEIARNWDALIAQSSPPIAA